MTADGVLVFDVNDFDEAFVGPFTWDVRRLAVSLALLAYNMAFSDEELRGLVTAAVAAYVDRIEGFAGAAQPSASTLTRRTTTGRVRELLCATSLRTRAGLLAASTVIEGYQRHFAAGEGVRRLPAEERVEVDAAFREYAATVPAGAGALDSRVNRRPGLPQVPGDDGARRPLRRDRRAVR